MTTDRFTDPDDADDDWADVRMQDPDEGEWDVDVVVVGGRVEYVDLRIRRELLTDFIGCLVDDVGDDRAESILTTIADRTDVELPDDGSEPAE